MKNKILVVVTILTIVVFSSCNKTNILKIEFDNVTGLDEKSPILLDGIKVGTIKGFHVQPTLKILVKVEVNKNITINQDSKFVITSLDILGNKGITIENGNSKSRIDFQKIQEGKSEKRALNDSSILNIIPKLIINILDEKK